MGILAYLCSVIITSFYRLSGYDIETGELQLSGFLFLCVHLYQLGVRLLRALLSNHNITNKMETGNNMVGKL
jgi:hypothetical protein